MSDHDDGAASRNGRVRGTAKHVGGFFASGALAFSADAGVLWLLTTFAGIGPLLARVASVAVAIMVSWQAHRRFTFRVATPPTVAEFARFVASAATTLVANYAIYAAILIARPDTPPVAALFAASLVAMLVSYAGMRLGVFGRPNHD